LPPPPLEYYYIIYHIQIITQFVAVICIVITSCKQQQNKELNSHPIFVHLQIRNYVMNCT